MTTPLSGTNVRLLTGVPFSNDYKHTRWFDSESEQLTYFAQKPSIYGNVQMNFQREEDKTVIQVPMHIDKLHNVNYIEFMNADYGDKKFYCFVTGLEYANGGNTKVHFQVDVIQTWMTQWKEGFKPSYVNREHCQLRDENDVPIVNTVDEGLNYGLEYDDIHVNHFVPNQGVKWLVMVCTKLMHVKDGGTKDKSIATYNGAAQPLTYYVLPVTLDGQPIKFMSGSDDIPMSTPDKLLSTVYETEGATKNIVSIYITDSIGCPIEVAGGGETPYNITLTEKDQKLKAVRIGEGDKVNDLLYVEDVKRYKTETFPLEGRYEHLPHYRETKLYMYPYTIITMDDFKGNRTDYKIENIYDPFINLNIKGSMGTSNNVTYGIQKYNDKSESTNHQDNQYALVNNTPQDIPVITDYLAAYLQGNKNSIENQKNSIMFNGMMGALNSGTQVAGGLKNPNLDSGGMQASFGTLGAIQSAGSSVLQLQGLEAKQQDIGNIPPQLTKQGSNTAYSFGHRYDGVTIIKKTLKPEYRRKLEDFFNMYGYKLGKVKKPNFHTRKSWNYVETVDCVITGNFNNTDLRSVKNIIDGGITFWHTDDVGNYNLGNEVI